ncbi:sporulation integral membrane protein YtvI [Paenibacillus flagellatus]|uniref:Sporulation integral membrane protein YtvI n=1 Tax=Paenibacillus flagellatus TaxID=2211139 RepID=A0A2V5KB73_9BACL|nr:sporulation integral membrane protein YtvI [Paenibacillus flagellatus]PYI56152.1 sporulation integral membrane protein YtvI [Paenibacillus flagellatus]
MLSFYKKYYKTVFDIGLMVLTVYLFMLAFSYLYRIATPIFLAFVIFAIIEPFARFLNRKGLKKSIATSISTLLFVVVLLGVIIGAGAIFTAQIYQLTQKIPDYARILQEQIVNNMGYWQSKLDALPPDWIDRTKEYSTVVTDKGAALATAFLGGLFGMLTSVSSFVFNFAIGIILAYFLSVEIESWKRLATEKTPRTFKTAFFFLRENVLKGIVTYIKAQSKLIALTFAVIFVALLLLGVKNAFSIALLSAIFDVLPLLGVSTVFIPWIIYLFVVGNVKLAIWLTVLLAVVIGTRQILEPKITGDSLGVSAFTMLAFMIVSLSLFGVAGVILSPVLIILIKALYDQGYLRRWIRLPEEEYDKRAV